ncbi:MAG: MlaD family protein [Nitrospirota bacterium]|nr:MlaD family protein [Nitrospirota bacterium]
MKRSTNLSLSEMRVGLIVGVSFLVSFLVIIAYGKISNVFTRQIEMTTLFHNVQGLTEGAPVRILGIDSGYVSSVQFVRFGGERYVKVTMKISKQKFGELTAGTTASIHTQGLMGIKYLELTPENGSQVPLNTTLPIIGTEEDSIQNVMKSGKEVVGNLTTLSRSLNELAQKAESGQGTVGKLLSDPSLYRHVDHAAKSLSSLATKIDSGQGTVGKIFASDSLYQNMNQSIDSLNRMIRVMNSGPGISGKILNDPELARSFKDSLEKLDAIMTQIQSGKGVAGEILYDPKMAERLDGTLDKVNQLLQDMKEHPKKYFKVEVHIF